MRIPLQDIAAITRTIYAIDTQAKIYLFGSRTDDTKKGGDIDIFILSAILNNTTKRQIKLKLYDQLGEQKIDIIIEPNWGSALAQIVLKEGVSL